MLRPQNIDVIQDVGNRNEFGFLLQLVARVLTVDFLVSETFGQV